MKRAGHLFPKVCDFQNLILSARSAARGKKKKPRVARFLQDLEHEILALEHELRTRTYSPRPYFTFKVHDPKERMICAADFRDRVVHHAVCRVMAPIFENSLIYATYACRPGKGPLKAVRRAQAHARRFGYFLKLDIRKFFDSVDHAVLKGLLRRKVKDPDLLWLMDRFIDHPVPWTAAGKGLPIGNLTSQHFANFYLARFDHRVIEQTGIGGYLRYMDDLLLFSDEKTALWDAAKKIDAYLHDRLCLEIKADGTLLSPVSQGIPFLGFRVFPNVTRIDRRGWRRFRRKMAANQHRLIKGEIDETAWVRSTASLVGHLQQANTRNLRANFFQGQGLKRHQPGDPRRQLEQRCQELPFGHAQQQRSRQPQQQRGLSPLQLTATARCGASTDSPPAPTP